MPRNQLTDMKYDEVSLVDRGANQYAKTVISKRDSNDTEENVEPEIYDEDGVLVNPSDLQVGDVIVDEDGNEHEVTEDDFVDDGEEIEKAAGWLRNLPARAGQRAGAAGRRLKSEARGLKGAEINFSDKLGNRLADGIGGRANALRDAGGDLNRFQRGTLKASGHVQRHAAGYGRGLVGAGAATAAGAGAAAHNAATSGRRENVGKSFSEEIREELSKAMGDTERDEIIAKALGSIEEYAEIAKAAEAAAHEERELRLEAEYVEVAKSYAVGVEPEVLGPVLKRCAEALSPEDQEVLAHALSVGTEAIEKFFDEAGTHGGGSNSDVLNSVDAYLDENVAKSAEDRNAAIVKMFEKNPDLYTEYDAERQHAIRYGY